jgi:uncharacterized membrane protein
MKMHPIHLLLIHFPAALLPVDLVFSLIANFRSYPDLAMASYYCLLAGVAGGWVAMGAGAIDLFKYVINSGDSLRQVIIHASLQTVVVFGFTVLLGVEHKNQAWIANQPMWLLIMKVILTITMFVGNYFGGEVLFNTVSRFMKSTKP